MLSPAKYSAVLKPGSMADWTRKALARPEHDGGILPRTGGSLSGCEPAGVGIPDNEVTGEEVLKLGDRPGDHAAQVRVGHRLGQDLQEKPVGNNILADALYGAGRQPGLGNDVRH